MAKRKDIPSISITDTPPLAADAVPSIALVEAPTLEQKVGAPKAETATGELARAEKSKIEAAVTPAPSTDALKVDEPKITSANAAKAEMPKAEMPKTEAPKVGPAIETQRREEGRPSTAPQAAPTSGARSAAAIAATAAAAKGAAAAARPNRFVLLAASVALAAAFGAVAGALGASGIVHMTSAPQQTAASEPPALQATIGKLRSEVASLRTSIDAANKSAHGQFGKIAERFDRVERAQTDRSGKLAKAVEGIERLERRVDAAPANDVTGSISPPPSALAAQGQPQPPIVSGWMVRNVYRGVAVLQGRRLGVVEVERGDVLPGVGRIEQIKRQDGHWVVVTSKGLITASMR